MDSSKAHVPVPLPPGLHSVQSGAIAAHPITSVSPGSAFPAVAASTSNTAALQAAREAAALRESYLKNEKKQKCATCGNTARARCPYRSCRTCCMKNNKMCYIHGKTEMAANGSTMMGTAYERYQAAADMAMVNMSPQFRQPAPPTYVQSGAAGPGRYQSPSAGVAYGPQYYRPPFPGTQVPPNWSKVTPGAPQPASHTREQLEYMRLKSYRAAAQAIQKEANALSVWRMKKWKEFDEVEAALEDEAFDRYASTMSWLEEVFLVDAPALEGISEDGHLLVEDIQVDDGTQAEIPSAEASMLSEGFRLKSATNPRKKELSRQRFKRGVDRNLQKLKTKEENVEVSLDDDDYNLPVLPLGRHAKRLKSTCKEGRDCIKRMDAFDYVLQKVNDIKSRDDIWRCVNLYKDSFGPAIGCILPHLTRSEDDFLGFAVPKRIKVDSTKDPDWMDIDDSGVPVATAQPKETVQPAHMEVFAADVLEAVKGQQVEDCVEVAAADVLEDQGADGAVTGQKSEEVVQAAAADVSKDQRSDGAVRGQEGEEAVQVSAANVIEDEGANETVTGQQGEEVVQVSAADVLEDEGANETVTDQEDKGVKAALDVVEDRGADGAVTGQVEGLQINAADILLYQGLDGAGMSQQGEEVVEVVSADVMEHQGADEVVMGLQGEEGVGVVSVNVTEHQGAGEVVMSQQGVEVVEVVSADVMEHQGADVVVVGQQGEGVEVVSADAMEHQGAGEVVMGHQGEEDVEIVAADVIEHQGVDMGLLGGGVQAEEVSARVEDHGGADTDLGGAEPGASAVGDRTWAEGVVMEQGGLEDLQLVSDDTITGPGEQQGSDIISVEEIIAACELSGEIEDRVNQLDGMDIGIPGDTAIDLPEDTAIDLPEDTAIDLAEGSLEAVTKQLDLVPTVNAVKPTIPEQTQNEVRKLPHALEVARPRSSANEDIVQPQNDFPAICVCAWRRVDMTVQTADEVLQALIIVEGLQEL